MKLRWPNQNSGFTLTEAIVIIGVIAILAVLIIPPSNAAKPKTREKQCVSNLNQIGIAMKVWEGDNGDKFPMSFCLTNEVEMKLVGNGHTYILFETLSNFLNSPKILHCPADNKHITVTNFSSLSDANISYFLNLDASDAYPAMFLSGDDNFLVNGKEIQPGILALKNGDSLAWQANRHNRIGNASLADGSVQQLTSTTLQNTFANSFIATNSPSTNRLVIP